MTKYNHDERTLSGALGVSEEEYNETSERVIEELRDMVSHPSISKLAEAIEIWVQNGTDLERAAKYFNLAKITMIVGMA